MITEPLSRGWPGFSRVSLEHLDSESLKIRRWGSPDDVESTKLRFRPGDIIFGKRRAYQRKLAVADFEGICSAHAMVLRAKPAVVLPKFLPFLMQSDVFMKRAMEISVGSLSPTINWKTLARQEFALPPLESQQRICELLLANVESVHALEKLAVASDLVARAAVDTCVADSPSGPLGTVASFVTSGSRGWAQYYAETGDLFLRVTNLRRHSVRLDMSDRKFVRPPEGAEGSRTLVRDGDVLVAITGEYLGMIGLAPEVKGRAYVNQHIAIVRIDPQIADPVFAAFALTSSAAQRSVWSKNDGGTKPGMTLGQVRSLPIPFIPLDEQKAWAARFEQFERQRDKSHSRVMSARQVLQAVLNSELS